MKTTKILLVILGGILLVWCLQALLLWEKNISEPRQISNQGEKERTKLEVEFKSRGMILQKQCEQKRYIATGKTVYDRIFNRKSKTLVELMHAIAKESFP